MHGVVTPTQRETGDQQDDEVIVLLQVLCNEQKQRSDMEIAMDMMEEERSLETEPKADEDEDYELLFGHKRQAPTEREAEKPSKISRKAIRVRIERNE